MSKEPEVGSQKSDVSAARAMWTIALRELTDQREFSLWEVS